MSFISFDFAFFLPVVFFLYWFVLSKSIKAQNVLLVIASYYFYACWNWKFLFLIIFSTLSDYLLAICIEKSNKRSTKKLLLFISISINIGFLGFFKYYNFFIESFIDTFALFGHKISISTLNIILPVGISFYTFQTMSYSIDVYRKKIEVNRNFISFATFVSFFPQLVAGPIERAKDLLPQFSKAREFKYQEAVMGMRQILWGLVKKCLIADNCAIIVNQIFGNYTNYSSQVLFLGMILFSLQIYGDFSGYSDMAIGISKLFSIDLRKNFAYPYFSRDVAEFWRRWHISLSTWFRDYVYIPLGGSQVNSMLIKVRNVFVIFLISGFWHGANWTFIAWGFINALYFIPLMVFSKNRNHLDNIAETKIFPSLLEITKIVCTFILISFTWIFFRSESITHALNYIFLMFSINTFTDDFYLPKRLIGTILLFLIVEWSGRRDNFAIEKNIDNFSKAVRWLIYIFILFILLNFSANEQEFIYFQF